MVKLFEFNGHTPLLELEVAIDKHIGIKFWSPQRIRGCVQCVFLWSVLVDPGPTRLLVTTHRGWGIAKKSQEQA
jgi:hypothetical protein